MRAILTLFVWIALIMTGGHSASAEKRVALIIGNAAYKNISRLANPTNDAALMETALTAVGFKVIVARDADINDMRRAIRNFGRELRTAGKDAVGLFYYAGHGVQSKGSNFLIPLGAQISDEADLSIEAISTGDVLTQMEGAGNKLNLVILDSCRNNPFKGSVRSASRGLARIDTASGTLVAFAAAPGQEAIDGRGENSPYTEALAEYIQKPNLSVEQVFKQVRNRVEEASGGKQTPWEESSLKGDFYFVGNSINVTVQQGQPGEAAFELSFWETIKNSPTPGPYEEYLKAYPQGRFSGLAKLTIDKFKKAEEQKKQKQAAVTAIPIPKAPNPATSSSPVHQCDRLAAHPSDVDRIGTEVPFQALKGQAPAAVSACKDAVSLYPGESRFEFQLARALDAQQNHHEAAQWYRKAAERGYTAAMYSLGVSYDQGEGIDKNPSLANYWYRLAARQGEKSAMWNLSINLDEGTGGRHDPVGAANFLVKAYLAGHDKAKEAFGKNLEAWQIGTRREVQRVLQIAGHYNRPIDGEAHAAMQAAMERYVAAEAGLDARTVTDQQSGTGDQPAIAAVNPTAGLHRCDTLAAHPADTDRIASAVSFSTLQNQLAEALAACRDAVGRFPGTSRFEFQLARTLDARKLHPEAVAWYTKAANRGYTAAMYNLAVSYDEGEGTAQDPAQANHWYRKAAEQGRSSAMWNLAINLDEGKGGPPNPKDAARYLLNAYKVGHKKATEAFGKGLTAWQAATRREVQQALHDGGYYKGIIDGQIGNDILRAARRYRHDG